MNVPRKASAASRPRPVPWHSLDTGDVFTRLSSAPEGITAAEVVRRLANTGPNELRIASAPAS